ncbi:sodium-dependent proline transporter isoform X2 [Lepeophtheirus salmonis]|uniref:sodium-dependent proline transporter isoform X2 n=1 Tax=Lepeophtheirus salmonis TaxID=72036 RepID=UPI001AEAB2FA|nr:sodium-dependent proline transporter-like isoform X2 [Lepeophtheirus salmonis]
MDDKENKTAEDENQLKPSPQKEEGDDNDRGNWTGQLDFLLSCLGYAVGLGNVWRFPYLCYKHGGGTFLVPYFIMLFAIGIPCFFMEISIGQYSGNGPITLYSNLSPIFKGLGLSNFISSCFVGLYYNLIIAWTIYYMFISMQSVMPWISCTHEYNTPFCFSVEDFRNCNKSRMDEELPNYTIYHNGSCISDLNVIESIRNNFTFYYGCELYPTYLKVPGDECSVMKNESAEKIPGIYTDLRTCVPLENTTFDASNITLFDIPVDKRKSSAEEYLKISVLNENPYIFPLGGIQWHLCLCLLAAWIIIFLCLFKGIKSSGKVVYFTATFPYLVLLILLVRAVTLDGAADGLKFYLVLDWSKLFNLGVWQEAASQIFFSLSVGGGGLITLASYNKFHNNVVRDTMIVCFGNCFTSVFAGFAIFSVLGFLAKQIGVEVKDVVDAGPGLAFIAYPDLVSQLQPVWLWAILFFFMLLTLGLDSQFAMTETVLSGILDYKPELRKYKTILIGIICIVGFLIGLPLTTSGGSYLLDLLDYYAANWTILYIGLLECLIISYVYGIKNFLRDLNSICKFKLNTYFEAYFVSFYSFLTPLLIFAVLFSSIIADEGLKRGEYVFPDSANNLGLSIALIIMLVVPAIAIGQYIYDLVQKDDGLSPYERLQFLLHHTEEWRSYEKKAKAERAAEEDDIHVKNGIDNLAMTDRL